VGVRRRCSVGLSAGTPTDPRRPSYGFDFDFEVVFDFEVNFKVKNKRGPNPNLDRPSS
jgi:hypothetical protein